MRGCSSGSVDTPGHSLTELYQRLVDYGSVEANSGLTARCHPNDPYPYEGVKAEHQEKCALPFTEDHLLGELWNSTML